MDEQKKQKVLLALVAVLVLGAGGSYWFFIRDSGADVKSVARSGPTQRRQRATSVTPKRKRKNRVRKDRNVVQATQRKVRKSQDNRSGSERKRKGRRRENIKKKKASPAA